LFDRDKTRVQMFYFSILSMADALLQIET